MNKNDKKPKKIILIVPIFPQVSETFIVSKFLGLLKRGWDVHIVCQHIDNHLWTQIPELQTVPPLKARMHRTWPDQPRWLAALLLLPGLLYSLLTAPEKTIHYLYRGWSRCGWGILRNFYLDIPLIILNPDIVHFEFGSLAVNRTHLKDLLGSRLSVSFRGYDLNFVALDEPNHYQHVWETVNACHFLSEHLWKKAISRGCPANLPHALIPPALDLRSFPMLSQTNGSTLGTATRPLRILSIGRLEWKKGYEHAMMAVKLLRESGIYCNYCIIGSGDYTEALHFARHQLGLEEQVEFLGGMTHQQVLQHLDWADVFLHPSLSEGFCNAVLEAQAVGLPVVCTDAGGLGENISDGETGILVPRWDPTAMAHKLALLAQDGTLRQRMGHSGRKRVEVNFQLEQQLDAFEGFYTQLCEERPWTKIK